MGLLQLDAGVVEHRGVPAALAIDETKVEALIAARTRRPPGRASRRRARIVRDELRSDGSSQGQQGPGHRRDRDHLEVKRG